MEDKFVHPKKALLSIDVILSGTTKVVNSVQSEKIEYGIDVIFFDNFTSVRLEQLENTYSSI